MMEIPFFIKGHHPLRKVYEGLQFYRGMGIWEIKKQSKMT